MASCPKCGSSQLEADGTCPACEQSRGVRQAELKIDPRRLEDAPEADALPEPGAWGRGSDAPPPGVTRLPRRNRRTPGAAIDRNAALKLDAELEPSGGQVVPLRGTPQEGTPTQVDAGAGGAEASDVREPGRSVAKATRAEPRLPPVLASVALRRDLAPAAPDPAALRVSAALLGLVGALGAVLVSGAAGLGLVLGGTLAVITLVGFVPMSYASRATAIVTLAGGALIVVTWGALARDDDPGSVAPAALLLGVLVLSTALLFRAWHRASLLARVLTLLGMSGCIGWLWIARSLSVLTILDPDWQAWMPPVMQIPLALILMLSLLAFMDSRSTGACGLWASLLLLWYLIYQWSGLLARYWPRGAAGIDPSRIDPQMAAAHLVEPLLTALLAIGLAQLLAATTAKR